jgi:multidrug efflux system outer membrane protein
MSQPLPAAILRALAGLLVLPVCACTTPGAPRSVSVAIDVPAAWSAGDSTDAGSPGAAAVHEASLAQWWQRFDDAPLNDLVLRTLQDNTSIVAARGAVRQAQAQRDLAAAALSPTLDATASAQRGTAGGHSTGNRFNVGLGANWELDVFGARRAALEASDAAMRASSASLGDTQVQTTADVALQYIVLRTALARLAVARSNLASQEETLQITDWRQQAGLVAVLEVEQARAAALQTRAAIPPLQTRVEQARHALAVLSGRPPAALAALGSEPSGVGGSPGGASGDAAAEVPQARVALPLGIPADTLRRRPDVRAAEYQVAAALSRVDQAQAQRWPSFAIGGSLGLSAASLGALTNGASVLSSLLASISLPLFDGGAARAQVRSQQAAVEQAQQAYRATVLAALKDVENALVALGGDRLRLVSLRAAALSAGSAASLGRQRFTSGLVDFQTVLETQRTEFSTQDAVLNASADLANDQVSLFKALGGGWRESDAGLPLDRSVPSVPVASSSTNVERAPNR